MKKAIIMSISVLHMLFVVGQTSFSGQIIYKVEPQNPNPLLLADSLFQRGIKSVLGGELFVLQKYFYNKGSYKSEVKMGEKTSYELFSPFEKKVFTWHEGTDTVVWVSSLQSKDTIKAITPIRGEEVVLGVKCKKLLIISSSGETTYWYNPKQYKINYELFKTHIYGHWSEYLKIAGALPLKYEVKTPTFHIVTTAMEVKEEKIESSVFRLPLFKAIIQSPTN